MDPEDDGRLGEARLVEDRPEGGEPLAADIRPAAQQGRQERPGLAGPVGNVMQVAQQAIGRQRRVRQIRR